MSTEGTLLPNRADPEIMYRAMSKLTEITKFFRNYCYQSVIDMGFSMGEIDVLLSLDDFPEQNTVRAISENVHLSKGMISQAVESLRKKQFVTVGTDERDRRSVLVSLNSMAQPVLEKLREAYATFVEKILSGVESEQLNETLGVLTKVYRNTEHMKAPGGVKLN